MIVIQIPKYSQVWEHIGIKALGVKALGVKALGVKALGVKALGVKALGVKALAVKAICVKALGVKALGVKTLVIKALNVKELAIMYPGNKYPSYQGTECKDTCHKAFSFKGIRPESCWNKGLKHKHHGHWHRCNIIQWMLLHSKQYEKIQLLLSNGLVLILWTSLVSWSNLPSMPLVLCDKLVCF